MRARDGKICHAVLTSGNPTVNSESTLAEVGLASIAAPVLINQVL